MEFLESLGIKLPVIIAGFIGSLAALPYLNAKTPLQKLSCLIGGTASAAYLTPLALVIFDEPTQAMHGGLAFVMGIVGMNVIGGIFQISDKFKNEPLNILNRIRGLGK